MAKNPFLFRESGFTLIEILIAIGVLILVIGTVFALERDLFSISTFLDRSFLAQEEVKNTVSAIVSELRSASISDTGGYPLEQTSSTSIAFYANIDKDALKERIHYFLSGTSFKKSVVKPAGQPITYSTTTAQETLSTVLRDVFITATTSIFYYYDSYYAGTSSPLNQPVDVAAVRLINIDLVVDADPNLLPPPLNASSRVTIRNLKSNL